MCSYGKVRESKRDEVFLLASSSCRKKSFQKKKACTLFDEPASKGNDAGVVALRLLSSPPASTFPACVPAQTGWDRMRVPKRLFLPLCHMSPGCCTKD